MVWEFGKVPEVAMEIVSNKVGGELDQKLKIYQRMRVLYYIVYDPQQHLGEKKLRIFTLTGLNYEETEETWLKEVDLGLTLWEGEFEAITNTWLRWCDEAGNLLLTGDERAINAENELEKLKEKLRQQSISLD
jgi:hypothetical protein